MLLFDTICYVGICRIKNYLMSEGKLVAWPEQFFSLSQLGEHVKDLGLNEHVLPPTENPTFERGEYAGELPVNFLASIV